MFFLKMQKRKHEALINPLNTTKLLAINGQVEANKHWNGSKTPAFIKM